MAESWGNGGDPLDSALRSRLQQMYRARFDQTLDGPASPAGTRAPTHADTRMICALHKAPLPVGPVRAGAVLWEYKRTAQYLAELHDLLLDGKFSLGTPHLRTRQRRTRGTMDATLLFWLPSEVLGAFAVRDLLNATLPSICALAEIVEHDISAPFACKSRCTPLTASMDLQIWLNDGKD